MLRDIARGIAISKRAAIPTTLAAKVLFESDRTCCVCRARGKPIQIHHVDGNHANSSYENLAVLCLECHTDTQIRGGFHRKLDADQVILYRSDWHAVVSRGRAQHRATTTTQENRSDLGALIKNIERLKAQREYEELIFIFDNLDQPELRNKYIDLYLRKARPFEEEFYFRAMQGRLDLLPPEKLKKQFLDYEAGGNWLDLSYAYFRIGDKINGAKYMCKHVFEAITRGSYFNAAFCLRNMIANEPVEGLFEAALTESREKKDLFWELRSLEELGWTDELMTVLRTNVDVQKGEQPHPFNMFEEYIKKLRSDPTDAELGLS